MRLISRKVHGLLDYLVGILLIASPWLFSFYDGSTQTFVPIALGVAAILYSLITDYELGLTGVISFSAHLVLDTCSGIFLAASPWIFGFSDQVYVPHLVLGLLELGAVLLTDKRPVGRSHPRS
jgi:hypothetical protein